MTIWYLLFLDLHTLVEENFLFITRRYYIFLESTDSSRNASKQDIPGQSAMNYLHGAMEQISVHDWFFNVQLRNIRNGYTCMFCHIRLLLFKDDFYRP